MGELSKIEWTDHTLNPWIGCTKVSEACRSCYAEVSTPARVFRSKGEETWGPGSVRHETQSWEADLRRWHREAIADGVRRRVFCASLADIFEQHPALPALRARLFPAIEAAPGLDLLLLTKRPENVLGMVPPAWLENWPKQVWLGTTVESQQRAEERIPHLLRVPAAVRFLSIEPMLGPVDLDPPTCPTCGGHQTARSDDPEDGTLFCQEHGDEMEYSAWLDPCADEEQAGVNWVIVGGESGRRARPLHPEWARAVRDQCAVAEVPFFFKQWGEHTYDPRMFRSFEHWVDKAKGWFGSHLASRRKRTVLVDTAGNVCRDGAAMMAARDAGGFPIAIGYRTSKQIAGRELDGRVHDGFPVAHRL